MASINPAAGPSQAPQISSLKANGEPPSVDRAAPPPPPPPSNTQSMRAPETDKGTIVDTMG